MFSQRCTLFLTWEEFWGDVCLSKLSSGRSSVHSSASFPEQNSLAGFTACPAPGAPSPPLAHPHPPSHRSSSPSAWRSTVQFSLPRLPLCFQGCLNINTNSAPLLPTSTYLFLTMSSQTWCSLTYIKKVTILKMCNEGKPWLYLPGGQEIHFIPVCIRVGTQREL